MTNLVADAPHGNPNTFTHREARLGDRVVVRLLLSELRAGDILRDTDIEFRDCNIQAGTSKASELRLHAADLTKDEVGLRADTVDRDSSRLEPADERDERVDLRSWAIQVVVVDVELCGRVRSARGFEGDVDEGLSKQFVLWGLSDMEERIKRRAVQRRIA
jgi:hypothetical protein